MLLKDPLSDREKTTAGERRSVSEISWYADGPTKIAAAYAIMRF